MKPRNATPTLLLAVRWLLGGLMLWAAVSKLANPTAFLGALYGYELALPGGVLKLVAVCLPWMELMAGLMLLTNAWTETALLLTSALLAAFVVATGQAAVRGLAITCGCFDLSVLGLSEAASAAFRWLETPGFACLRNLALLAATLWVLRGHKYGPLLRRATAISLLPCSAPSESLPRSSSGAGRRRARRR